MNSVDCGLFTMKCIHNMLILGSSSLFMFTDGDDSFKLLNAKSNIFHFDNNDMHLLRREMKKLISFCALTNKHCVSTKMTSEAKSQDEKSPESEISVSVIPVDESKKEGKDSLELSRAEAEVFVSK